MTKKKDLKDEGLVEIAIDPDVLAKELSVEIEIDPLEKIDEDIFSKGNFTPMNSSKKSTTLGFNIKSFFFAVRASRRDNRSPSHIDSGKSIIILS